MDAIRQNKLQAFERRRQKEILRLAVYHGHSKTFWISVCAIYHVAKYYLARHSILYISKASQIDPKGIGLIYIHIYIYIHMYMLYMYICIYVYMYICTYV